MGQVWLLLPKVACRILRIVVICCMLLCCIALRMACHL